jgi:hypothetical protein
MKHLRTQCLQRTVKNALLAGLLGGFGAVHSHAQYTFNSGSTGADGALNVTSNTTLALPANGVFNYTTITVASNATLTFTPNALNTPVYLLAQGDVTINGTIDVSGSLGSGVIGGAGGPGGFAGGNAGNIGFPAGDGHGPGAGRAGYHSFTPTRVGTGSYGSLGNSTGGDTLGSTYGSPLLVPLVGGSGGGGRHDGYAGAGGGGAILLASNIRIHVSGTIVSSSSPFNSTSVFGWGSGGAIRLVSPSVSGSGSLNARGGYYGPNPASYYGGAGRIRIDCMDRRSLALSALGRKFGDVFLNSRSQRTHDMIVEF